MTIKTKKCPSCQGQGIILENKSNNTRQICPVCQGLGVPVFDEDYDNARTFMGEEDDDIYIDLDEED